VGRLLVATSVVGELVISNLLLCRHFWVLPTVYLLMQLLVKQ
jgi:hypothetical protein